MIFPAVSPTGRLTGLTKSDANLSLYLKEETKHYYEKDNEMELGFFCFLSYSSTPPLLVPLSNIIACFSRFTLFHEMCCDSCGSSRIWHSLSRKDGGAPISPLFAFFRPPLAVASASAASAPVSVGIGVGVGVIVVVGVVGVAPECVTRAAPAAVVSAMLLVDSSLEPDRCRLLPYDSQEKKRQKDRQTDRQTRFRE